MNPQGREGGNSEPPTTPTTPTTPTVPIAEPNAGGSNPLNPSAGLEDVVNAAKEAAAAQAAQFAAQFAPEQVTPPTTGPTGLDTALSGFGTPPPADTSTPQSEPIQPVETLTQPGPELTSAPQSAEEPDPQQEFRDKVAEAAEELLKALEEKKAA